MAAGGARRTRRRTTNSRPSDRSSASIPWTTDIAISAGASSSARCGRRRGGPCRRSRRRRRRSRSGSPSGGATQTAGRPDEAALERVGDLGPRQRDRRQRVEPGVGRAAAARGSPSGPDAAAAARSVVERVGVVEVERAAARSGPARRGTRRSRAAPRGRGRAPARTCRQSSRRRRSRSGGRGRCRPTRRGRAP